MDSFMSGFGIVHEAEGCEKINDGHELLGERVKVKRVYENYEFIAERKWYPRSDAIARIRV